MSNEKQHSEQHEALLKKQALEQQEVKEVLAFFQKYSKPAIVVIIAICAIILSNRLIQTQRQSKELKADTALTLAQTPEALMAIYEDYSSTPAAPLALMSLAKGKFNNGLTDEAQELYSTFVKQYPKHEMFPQAELNLINCKEANGQLGDAHLLYAEFAQKYADNVFLAPVALLGKARCLVELEQYSEAQIVYENIIVNYPESSWAREAEASLSTIAAKQ